MAATALNPLLDTQVDPRGRDKSASPERVADLIGQAVAQSIVYVMDQLQKEQGGGGNKAEGYARNTSRTLEQMWINQKKGLGLFGANDTESPKTWKELLKRDLIDARKGKFKDIIKGLDKIANRIGGGLLDLLGFLAILSIFDPDGSFIMSIIDFLTGITLWLVTMLAGLIPVVVTRLLFILPKVISALYIAINTLLDGIIAGMYAILTSDNAPEGLKLLAWILIQIGGALKDGLKLAKDHTSGLIGTFIGLFIAIKLAAAWLAIYTFLQKITAGTSLAAAGGLGILAFKIMLVVLAVALLIIGFLALYWFINSVMEVGLSATIDKLKKKWEEGSTAVRVLLVVLGVLGIAVALLLLPFVPLIAICYVFFKIMQYLWKLILMALVAPFLFLAGVIRILYIAITTFIDAIKNPDVKAGDVAGIVWKAVKGGLYEMANGLLSIMKNVFSAIASGLVAVWVSAKSRIPGFGGTTVSVSAAAALGAIQEKTGTTLDAQDLLKALREGRMRDISASAAQTPALQMLSGQLQGKSEAEQKRILEAFDKLIEATTANRPVPAEAKFLVPPGGMIFDQKANVAGQ